MKPILAGTLAALLFAVFFVVFLAVPLIVIAVAFLVMSWQARRARNRASAGSPEGAA
ncbi:hypothetical protein SK069_13440 [Patulibacter brassicae]|uniref:DUF4229 domain-containing protein n=1 Tax=Patulibacter brassicae TaxID=1705717 RepID=A0ABU4VLE5_9ACTN|nr:hypothetical protein [Patulibacter brassicae]MDX8152603.1 hypothetical protein [Patulibacter brassicae]